MLEHTFVTEEIKLKIIESIIDVEWYSGKVGETFTTESASRHYLDVGAKEYIDPAPLFSTSWYCYENDDVVASDTNPLIHYMMYGWKEGRNPHPLFQTNYYIDKYQNDFREKINPLIHIFQSAEHRYFSPHPLFDAFYYLECNPDVAATGANPLIHFIAHGAYEGRSPHPLFDTSYYLERNLDVAAANMNPLVHFVSSGARQGRAPHPLFDVFYYLECNRDVAAAGANPLTHFVLRGTIEGRSPHMLFDTSYYLERNPDVAAAGLNPLVHFISSGAAQGRSPHPLFDATYYLEHNPDVSAANINPLTHFVLLGAYQGRSPHPLFDISYYLQQNPDVAAAGLNPLVHFISSGATQKRSPHPLFDVSYYFEHNPDVEAAGVNPLIHYIEYGADRGSNPNPMFNSLWYRDQHESHLDGINPLLHYVTRGSLEERNPSSLFDRDYYLTVNSDVRDAKVEPLSHFMNSGMKEGRQPRQADRQIERCPVMDIPFEIWKRPRRLAGRNVCVFVTYSAKGKIEDHVLYYINALRRHGLTMVLVIVTDGIDENLRPELDDLEGLVLRTNHGWDFAAWAAVLTAFPDIWNAKTLVLTNDSLYGPTKDKYLQEILLRVQESEEDIVALTDSYQNRWHIMSFFIGITHKGLASNAVRNFWNEIESIRNKDEVIKNYEIGSSDIFRKYGVSYEVIFPTSNDIPLAINPTLTGWEKLLNRGFPFLKVQLLRDDLPNVDRTGWREYLNDNRELLGMIDSHLRYLSEGGSTPTFRPIPSPRRRFKRSQSLTTFYGATQSTRPTQATDLAIEVPFRYEIDSADLPSVVAVIAHIFYPEMGEEILSYIENIPVQADLFLTTDSTLKQEEIGKIFSLYSGGNVDIRVFPNIGRDIAPTFVGCRDVFDKYKFFLHIHSKKSPHSGIFLDWRKYLLDNLLGSTDTVRSILRLLSVDNVGVVFAQHFPAARNLLNWGYDFDLAKELLAKSNILISRDNVLDFPSSSFFWARSDAIRSLINTNLAWSDFPPEEGQIDGTIMHAIERSILYFSENAGFRWVKVATCPTADPITTVPIKTHKDIEQGLDRVYRPLLGSPIRPLIYNLTSEYKPATSRPSLDNKPRLNLLIPTLHPKQIFGGISTALKIFDSLAKFCGERFEKRIICINTSVDLLSMSSVKDYTFQQLGDPIDIGSPIVVDISDIHGGELALRPNDFFVATAWWTAVLGHELQANQESYHHVRHPLIYLIQDYEPGFYPWSDRFGRAEASYKHSDKTIALINSEELANFMAKRYRFLKSYVIRYEINSNIKQNLSIQPRERIVLFYGRPSVDRNCFQTICEALYRWQQLEPTLSQRWRVISVGEQYIADNIPNVRNMEVYGKLELNEYASLLSRASIGISLMISPHPSYPPLEMAYAGLVTITNSYDEKDLSLRSSNFDSISSVNAEELTNAICRSIRKAEVSIGKLKPFMEIKDVPCDVSDYRPSDVADILNEIVDATKSGTKL